jgi:hypothetical protein
MTAEKPANLNGGQPFQQRWPFPRRPKHVAVEEPPAAAGWKASVALHLSGVHATEQERRCGLTIDRVSLPLDSEARI